MTALPIDEPIHRDLAVAPQRLQGVPVPALDPAPGRAAHSASDSEVLRAIHKLLRETERSRRVVIHNAVVAIIMWSALAALGFWLGVTAIIHAFQAGGGV